MSDRADRCILNPADLIISVFLPVCNLWPWRKSKVYLWPYHLCISNEWIALASAVRIILGIIGLFFACQLWMSCPQNTHVHELLLITWLSWAECRRHWSCFAKCQAPGEKKFLVAVKFLLRVRSKVGQTWGPQRRASGGGGAYRDEHNEGGMNTTRGGQGNQAVAGGGGWRLGLGWEVARGEENEQ